jgi:microcystin-dependent protein
MTMFAASTIPTGWLECNGAAVSRTTYSALFAVIGTTWGNGNGVTTFNLPETRGLFPRGWNHSSPNAAPYKDPDASSRIASNSGGATGDNVGTR